MDLVLATRNSGKVKELREMLGGLPVRLFSLADWPQIPAIPETGSTFRENALLKAHAVARETGLTALADDSGLEVDYLGGAPGVFSARFAGEPADDLRNNQKLLDLLRGVPSDKRTARFRCVLAVVTPAKREYVTEGECRGVILEAPRGSGGFGYDPLFLVPEYGQTMAELPLEVKNRISHRGRALRQAICILAELVQSHP